MSKLDEAIAFAATAHAGQLRKFSTLPYIVHPIEVMTIVAEVEHDEAMLIAAVLHDVVEDTVVGLAEIQRRFGLNVAQLVYQLTDVPGSFGNRKARKEEDRRRLSEADARVQTIKVADLISNTSSIVEHDRDFAKVYLKEKELVLNVLLRADQTLLRRARQSLQRGQELLLRDHLAVMEQRA